MIQESRTVSANDNKEPKPIEIIIIKKATHQNQGNGLSFYSIKQINIKTHFPKFNNNKKISNIKLNASG
jgi:hypothetical protein